MEPIQIFDPVEERIIDSIISELEKNRDMDDYRRITNTLSAINRLAESISLYPSLLDHQYLGKHSRSIETLVDNICEHKGLDLLLNTPTKALLGRNFAISKMNFFMSISYLCNDFENLCDHNSVIKHIVHNYVFSVMTEDVFISIISDRSICNETRHESALLLAKIWETRIYRGVPELSPMLIDLWRARLNFTPSYGTMAGISEITKFCTATNPMMLDFISDYSFSDDMLESLREYLMGLSYREIMKILEHMQGNSMESISRHDIGKILGNRRSYPLHDPDDPREIYHFFARRNDNAQFRRRSGLAGPKKTIEEYIVCYLIENRLITNSSMADRIDPGTTCRSHHQG